MIDRIKAFLEGRGLGGAEENTRSTVDEKQLAAAALMIEAALMDENFGDEERRKIADLVKSRYGLTKDECERLLAEAEAAVGESNQWFAFTRVVNDRFAHEERVELIEMMWEVAFADGVVHDYEDNLIRRISGLIYVSDVERGEAKRRVAERTASDSPSAGG
ncbi:MAG: hypothetical protein CMM50_05395 [Rhodospirillaceae bacterium]|nr:hypothetical protein [Rhodospirillaceae bacterium]